MHCVCDVQVLVVSLIAPSSDRSYSRIHAGLYLCLLHLLYGVYRMILITGMTPKAIYCHIE